MKLYSKLPKYWPQPGKKYAPQCPSQVPFVLLPGFCIHFLPPAGGKKAQRQQLSKQKTE